MKDIEKVNEFMLISKEEIDKIYRKDFFYKERDIRNGRYLDIYVKDKNPHVRECLANYGYFLDKLIYDKDKNVRIKVAEQGYGLDKLMHDEDPDVQFAVAKQGYRPDIFSKNPNKHIRMAVAYSRKGDQYLIHDDDYDIQLELLNHGTKIDIKPNTSKDLLATMAIRGQYDMSNENLDELFASKNNMDKIAAIKLGYWSEKIFNERSGDVREAALITCFKSNKLTHEEKIEIINKFRNDRNNGIAKLAHKFLGLM